MVRRAVSACVEDYMRGDAKFLGGGDAGDYTAGHGRVGLSLLQYSNIQSEAAGRSSPEGGPADRVIWRFQWRFRPVPFAVEIVCDNDFSLSQFPHINMPRCDRANRTSSIVL